MDPIKFEVIRNALLEATEEMAIALRRSAYSTNIKTRADFSCAFFDSRLRVVAQAFAQPNHLGSFVELVPRAVRTYGIERLGPGDAILTNDPYGGGVHLNDITLISPVYAAEESPVASGQGADAPVEETRVVGAHGNVSLARGTLLGYV